MSDGFVRWCPAGARWRSPPGVLVLIVLVLQAACAPGLSRSGPLEGSRQERLTPSSSEGGATHLPAGFGAVRLGDADFQQVMALMMPAVPQRGGSAPSPLYASRGRALASARLGDEPWRLELERSYGNYCVRCCTPGDCLGLSRDGLLFDAEDKITLALALAVGPAIEARDAELRGMFSTAQLVMTVGISIAGYLALLAMPEPVSKSVATAFGLMLWAYLGWELFDLMQGYLQLREEAARATTFAELREAGERFGGVIGPNSVRILVMLGTAAAGSTAQLLLRAPNLPGFAQAARSAESSGVRLLTAAHDADKVKIAVAEGSFTVVLPANAFSMAARGTLSSGSQAKSKPEWHHIATIENSKSSLRGGPWTPRFKQIFDKAGMSMDDPANKVQLIGHKGPHPQGYHDVVHRRLSKATELCSNKRECERALRDALQELAAELSDTSSKLYRLLTEGAPR
ncbi:AHH domain-containing protein [Archangium violaceum]|uniref:AHH domain-containing protein n=1 Tax=Archangium violaceum TaxID=83451 RepID=UPI002B283F28|nr:AHH domain-containing protein [Archangium gephyra]